MISSTALLPKTGSAVCLVSGGLDSACVLTLAVKNHERVIPIIFSYGQTHLKEIHCAQRICRTRGLGKISPFSLGHAFAGADSQLTNPEGYDSTKSTRASREQGLPSSFVPGRNICMIAVAASVAYSNNAQYIYGGWNAVDYSGYPDCRPSFLWAMESALRWGLDSPIEIVAPLVTLKKAEIIQLGVEHSAPFHLTWSCYKGGAEPCSECDSCKIRVKGFEEAGLEDPALS